MCAMYNTVPIQAPGAELSRSTYLKWEETGENPECLQRDRKAIPKIEISKKGKKKKESKFHEK